jgi:hypothetical protein
LTQYNARFPSEASLDALRVYEPGSPEGEEVCRAAVAKFNHGNRRPANSRQGRRPWRAGKHHVDLPAEWTEDPISGLLTS